jgi:hypothetical protein
MKRLGITTLLIIALASGCSSANLGSIGDILGSSSSTDSSDVRGTVNSIDTSARRIDLDTTYVNNLRDTRSNQSVYYDANTTVEYNGKTYRPEDLERGDQVSIQGSNQSGRFVATRITVTRDVT